jgi:hypothetical protein
MPRLILQPARPVLAILSRDGRHFDTINRHDDMEPDGRRPDVRRAPYEIGPRETGPDFFDWVRTTFCDR